MCSIFVILLFFTFNTSSGMVAGAKLFEASFGLSYHTALWIGTIVVVSYTLLGGFLAVAWTDFIQGSLMFLALIVVLIVALKEIGGWNDEVQIVGLFDYSHLWMCILVVFFYTFLGVFLVVAWTDFIQGILMFFALIVVPIIALKEIGGWNEAVQIVGQIDASHLNMIQGVSVIAIISSIAWGLGYFGQPHIIVRFMALRSPKDVPMARMIGTTWMVLGLYGAIFTGFIGLAYISTQDVSLLGTFGIDLVTK